MSDILTAVSLALSSVKTATEIAKVIKNTNVSLEKAELNLKVAEIINGLSDARVALADANDSVRASEAEIQRLKGLLEFKSKLTRHREGYYETNDNGELFGSPYCQHCWEAKQLAVHLTFRIQSGLCPSCKHEYIEDHVLNLDYRNADGSYKNVKG